MKKKETPFVYEAVIDAIASLEKKRELETIIDERVHGLQLIGLDKQPIGKILAEHAFILWTREEMYTRFRELLDEVQKLKSCCEDKEKLETKLHEMESKTRLALQFIERKIGYESSKLGGKRLSLSVLIGLE